MLSTFILARLSTPKASSMKQVTIRSLKTWLGSMSPKSWPVHALWWE